MNTKIGMPLYGPYSKKYMGISKIITSGGLSGTRFDLVLHPTLINSSVPVPNTTFPAGYHPWEASGDLSFFAYRYELIWKDRVYADIAFFKIDEDTYGIKTTFHNNIDQLQNAMLNYFSAIEYHEKTFAKLCAAEKICFRDGVDYSTFEYAVKRPWNYLAPDAQKRGTFGDASFLNGHGFGDRVENRHVAYLGLKPFGWEKGDAVSYRFDTEVVFESPVLAVRYRTVKPDNDVMFHCAAGVLAFPPSEELSVAYFPLETMINELTLTSLGNGNGIEIDFLAIVEANEQLSVIYEKVPIYPEISQRDSEFHYKYPSVHEDFYLTLYTGQYRCRHLETGCLEDALVSRLSNPDHTFDDVLNPFSEVFKRKQSDYGYYHNVFAYRIYLKPRETWSEYAVLSGKRPEQYTVEQLESYYKKMRSGTVLKSLNQAGKPYCLSNNILRATLLTNTVYPIFNHDGGVVHHTPGKRWNCFYTWDSGFIGLGLLESDETTAEYILSSYLADLENHNYAFVHHGSLVPVQFYLYQALLSRAQGAKRRSLLDYYPLMKRYYEFIAGRGEDSTTSRLQSGILTNYDYFYNASGMDDYPAQVAMHKSGKSKIVTGALFTSHVIRCAKILRMVAGREGWTEDVSQYQNDIVRLSDALQKYSWDEGSGYFSYVVHDETTLKPQGFYVTEKGENLNKGMDGVTPLVAGVPTPEQVEKLTGHLFNEREMLTAFGITAVDQSSSYYSDIGYWNGAVWFSHQWFLWKSMLDYGFSNKAWIIANRALNAWKQEVDESYNCFEMMHVATGRGGWFHHFGGLSAPLNIWFSAYYVPGTVSCGLNVWLESTSFSSDFGYAEIELSTYYAEQQSAILVVMQEKGPCEYVVHIDGEPADYTCSVSGALEISIKPKQEKMVICVSSK